MSREEQIKWLRRLLKLREDPKGDTEIDVALKCAIEELEQEPCTDAISRQSVIDTLTKTSGIRGDALKALYDLPSVIPQPNVGSSSEKPNKWIACSDKLPEDNTLVLVTVKVRNREPKVRSGYYYMNGHFHIDNGDCWEARDKELIAWMPLPTPPNKSEIPTGQIVANGELYPGEFDDPLAEEGSEE